MSEGKDNPESAGGAGGEGVPRVEVELETKYHPFFFTELPHPFNIKFDGNTGRYPPVGIWHFLLHGVPGILRAIPDPENATMGTSDQPLGPARYSPVLPPNFDQPHPDEEKQEPTQAAAVPLTFDLTLFVKSMDEYDRMLHYGIEFALGEHTYYLDCGGGDYRGAAERGIQEHGVAEIDDVLPRSDTGEEAVIPSTEKALKQVVVIFFEYDEGEGEEEEDAPVEPEPVPVE